MALSFNALQQAQRLFEEIKKRAQPVIRQAAPIVQRAITPTPIRQAQQIQRFAAPVIQQAQRQLPIVTKRIQQQTPIVQRNIAGGLNTIGKAVGSQPIFNVPQIPFTPISQRKGPTIRSAVQTIDSGNQSPVTSFLTGNAQNIPKQFVEGSKRYRADQALIGKKNLTPDEQRRVADTYINVAPIGGIQTVGKKLVSQAFKVGKFNVGPEELRIIQGLQQRLGLTTREVRSFKDMKAVAAELGTNPQKLIQDISKKRISDSEVVALGDVISTSSQRIASLTESLARNPNDSKLHTLLQKEEGLINQAIKKRITGGTEAGRAVVAYRLIANKTLDPTYWLSLAKKKVGTSELPAEIVNTVTDLINKHDRIGLATAISKLGESTLSEKAIGIWKAGLLTSPRTHIANIVSNAAFGGLETLKDIPATGFDMARSAITGGERAKSFGVSSITSQAGGTKKGFDLAKEVLKTGINPEDLGKAELRAPLRFGESLLGKAAQKYTDGVFRALGASDKVFYGQSFARSLADQAATAGRNQKLTQQAVKNLVKNPTQVMLDVAKKDAEYATFTNENVASTALSAARQAVVSKYGKGGEALMAGFDTVVPFVRTPTNVLNAALVGYTPIGFTKEVVSKLVNKDSVTNKELADAFGRSLTGVGLLWAGTELGKKAVITGPLPDSPSERAQWELEKKKPNSILLNGQYQNLSKIGIFGPLLSIGATYGQTGDMGQAMMTGLSVFSDMPFVQGISGLTDAIKDPKRYSQTYAGNYVSSIIPTVVGDVARGIDPYQREAKGIIPRLQSKTPGLRQNLPISLNSLGQKRKTEGGLAGALLNPFTPSTASKSPLVKELSDVGYNLNFVGSSVAGVALGQRQQQEYQKLAGQNIQKTLGPILASDAYKSMSQSERYDLVDRLVTKSKKNAQSVIKIKNLAIRTLLDGNTQEAKAMKQQYRFTLTRSDVKEYEEQSLKAKQQAIKLIKQGDVSKARELKQHYGFKLLRSEVE